MILYTDGITEAGNTAGNTLGDDGLMEIVRNQPVNIPGSLANRLLAAVQSFRGNALRDDDQSFLILRQHEG